VVGCIVGAEFDGTPKMDEAVFPNVVSAVVPVAADVPSAPKLVVDDVVALAEAVDKAPNENVDGAGCVAAVDAVDGILKILVVVDGGAIAAGAVAAVKANGPPAVVDAPLETGSFDAVVPPNSDGICALVAGVAPNVNDAVFAAAVGAPTAEPNGVVVVALEPNNVEDVVELPKDATVGCCAVVLGAPPNNDVFASAVDAAFADAPNVNAPVGAAAFDAVEPNNEGACAVAGAPNIDVA
jgi:hypothetical protein